jgi:hypothetical protein
MPILKAKTKELTQSKRIAEVIGKICERPRGELRTREHRRGRRNARRLCLSDPAPR